MAVLVLCLNARRNFSSASVSMNLLLAEYKAFKCDAIILLNVLPSKAGNLLSITDGIFGFYPSTN